MLLSAEHISLNFGLKPLLDDVTLYLSQGDKVGLIGINGTGKSSFLRVLAGQQPPDQGSVTRDPNVQVCFLPQNPPMEAGATVLEQVFAGFSPDTRALLDYEAKAMLTRLGLTDFAQPVGTLSGGQRKRVALAAVLLHPADVLILDEPTNHLDSDMVLWLEDRLRKFTGGLVMVTHDRYFLERVCNRITELSHCHIRHYEANYSKYLAIKTQQEEREQAAQRKRQSILRVEYQWIMRGAQARRTKNKDRMARYEALKAQTGPETDGAVQMATLSSRLGRKTVELHGVSKAFGDRVVLQSFSYGVGREDRVGIVGRNGAGKSTLLNLLGRDGAHRLLLPGGPGAGPGSAGIRLYPQHRRGGKDPGGELLRRPDDGTVPLSHPTPGTAHRQALRRGAPAAVPAVGAHGGPQHPAAGRAHQRPGRDHPGHSGVLSGDLPRGGDRRVPRPVLPGQDGPGNFRGRGGGRGPAVHRQLHRLPGKAQAAASREKAPKKPAPARPQRPKKLKFTFKEQREFDTIEDDIAALETSIGALEAQMAACGSDYVKLQELTEEQAREKAALEEKMERWVYLTELAEKIAAQEG